MFRQFPFGEKYLFFRHLASGARRPAPEKFLRRPGGAGA
jgi:hypothetical protein